MATCFLFISQLTDEGCLSLSLSPQGQVIAPLTHRSFSEIQQLQKHGQTMLVASSEYFSLHHVELPKLAEKKARAAIPFALEEKLAQDIDSLHFAFDQQHYDLGHYLVAVGDKDYLQQMIKRLDERHINFTTLTLDWFALSTNEMALLDHAFLVNTNDFKGALTFDLTSFYLEKWQNEPQIYAFADSNKQMLAKLERKAILSEERSEEWIAKRLLQVKYINICQGELQHGSNQVNTQRWYQFAFAMILAWLLSIILMNVIKIYTLNKDIEAVDAKIATIYREFFPHANQVISPKFRISQLLKGNQSNSDASFWLLLDKLAMALKSDTMSIEQLRYQNQILMVTIASKNFDSLDDLQNRLQQNKVKVRQNQAATRDKQVVATLELSL